MSITFVGIMFAMVIIAAILLELGAAYERHDYVLDVISRAATTAVESTMDDAYRRDGIRKLQTVPGVSGDARFTPTKNAFIQHIRQDLSNKYSLDPASFTYSFCETPASMTVSGSGSFRTVFSGFGFDDIQFSFSVESTNYDTTDFDLDG